MKKNVTITEASGFLQGGLESALRSIGFIPELISPPGVQPNQYRIQADDQQIAHLRLRFFSHKMDVEETPVVDPRDAEIARLRARVAELEAN